MTDRTTRLLRDGLAGDIERFEHFIEHVTPFLIAVARRCLRALDGRVDPDDVVQDAWASSLPKLPALQPRDGRMTPVVMRYLSRAIQRRARDLLVAATRRDGPSLDVSGNGVSELAEDSLSVISRVLAAERDGKVLAAIEALDPRDRDALVMLSIEQIPLPEVAVMLGISKDAAKQRHKRARDRLAVQLKGTALDELD